MDQKTLEKFRQQLLNQASGVRTKLDTAASEALRRTGGDAAGNLSNTPVHLGDLSSDTYENEVAISLLENEGQLLEQMSQALQRIDQGTYGRCTECGKDIPLERLQIVPYTPYCIQCATRLEQQPPGSA